jgi:hypothetical protein
MRRRPRTRASSLPRREIAIVAEEANKGRSMEQVRAHLAGTGSELLEGSEGHGSVRLDLLSHCSCRSS